MTTSESRAEVTPRRARKRRPYRRSEIQQAALRLFYERGFAETSMEDIGNAVGLAGPSIYRHFTSKAEILETALSEQGADFWAQLERVLNSSGAPETRLRQAVHGAVDWWFEHPLITAVAIQLRGHLGEKEQEAAEREDRRLMSAWVNILVAARPELDRPEAKLLVRGALDLVLAMALTRTSLSRQRAAEATRRAMLAALLA
jgi:AcrR family transcriptional regulator